MTPKEAPPVISNFLEQYDQGWYEELAEVTEKICKKAMKPIGIPALFEHRAKDVQSLEDKLIKRHAKQGYQGPEDIRKDIVDLAGVRIVIYMSQHMSAVENGITTTFQLQEVKEHPNSNEEFTPERRYSGYHAKHYRVRLDENQVKLLSEKTRKTMKEPLVEIQVVSILHTVWTSIQHDVEYKSLGNKPSTEELSILDLLNGLMQHGQTYLEKLHDISIKRIESGNNPFANKWDLGTWLSNWLSQRMSHEYVNLGPIEVLRRFIVLEGVAQHTPAKLESVLKEMKFGDTWPPALRDISAKLGKEERASILIIAHILRNKLPHDKSQRAFAIQTSSQISCEMKIRAMASAFVWLHELFPQASRWEKKVTDYARSKIQTTAVVWLLTDIKARTVMNGETKYDDTIKRKVDGLWKWMKESPIDVLCLSFSISKLGVDRQFPKEDEYMKLKAVHGILRSFL